MCSKNTKWISLYAMIEQKSLLFCMLLIYFLSSCKKLIEIPEPINTITTTEVFSNDANATSAMMGIYNDMIKTPKYSSQNISIYTGLSSDELKIFGTSSNPFQTNNLLYNDGSVSSLWNQVYFDIYLSNSIIEGLAVSKEVSEPLRKQLTAEAKFIRAFCNFYLVNLFGEVPLMTSTSWSENSLKSRFPREMIYQQVTSDLLDAKNSLPGDYSKYNNERIRANKWAAAALLSRTYLYIGKYDSAEAEASRIISTVNLYDTVSLNKLFLANSNEAIWQLQPVYTANFTNYVAPEPRNFIPPNQNSNPGYYLSNELLNSFEINDQRKVVWVNSINRGGITYYYPYKYTVRSGTANVVPSEYYMVLRLSEQYLIRAEARAKTNNLSGAISDLNIIRKRARLPNLSASLNQSQVLEAIQQENRIEFFAEWGHRWFDLKRTEKADQILSLIKGSNWQTTDQLYPIPFSEIQKNPNLKQNPGY